MEFILEIIKYILPALIVFLATYYILKQYLDSQLKHKSMEMRNRSRKTTLPLRLQAYERLSMFCERISIPNLVLRLRTDKMTVNDLRLALMIGIRQEYEHNISQQIYVSESLWKILSLARDEVTKIINGAAEKFDGGENAKDYSRLLNQYWDSQERNPLITALKAIKKEAGVLF